MIRCTTRSSTSRPATPGFAPGRAATGQSACSSAGTSGIRKPRLTALQGAQILFYLTAIGWHPRERQIYGTAQHESWELIQRSHGIANGCFVCAPNRIGTEIIYDADGHPASEDGIHFWGQSFVSGPDGQILAKASVDREEVVVVDCDLSRVEFSRTHWPFLRDRRIDAYGGLTRRYIDPGPPSPVRPQALP